MVEIGDRAIEVARADVQEPAIRVIIWSAAPKADRVVEIRERLRQLLVALSQSAAQRIHICVLRIAFDGAFEITWASSNRPFCVNAAPRPTKAR
jgi:hypothetical protein